jgi:hypothetical protein
MLQEKLEKLTQERAGLEQTRAQLTDDLNRVNISIERVRGAEILAKELIAEANRKPATDDDQGDEESENGNRKGRRVIKT